MDDYVHDIEAAFVGHWSHMGGWTHGTLRDDGGALRFETPIAHLPYNGVIRTQLSGDPERTIAEIASSYRRRKVDFMWIVHPTADPGDLPHRLGGHGLVAVETVTGMALDLDGWQEPPPPSGVVIAPVEDDAALKAYEDINIAYFELPETARGLIDEMIRYWLGRAPVQRFVAWLDGKPVGKGLLSFAAPDGVAAIYGMSVKPEARRRGIAGGITSRLCAEAKAAGKRRVVLHASDEGAPVYRKVGFLEHCSFTVFGTAPLWSVHDHHH